jgi:hypothetical protein
MTFNEEKCFEETRKEAIKIFDDGGFYKALYESDEFAIAINEVCMIAKKINWKGDDWKCVGEMISGRI